MTVLTLPETVPSCVDDDEDESHYFCYCDENIALCGEDLHDAEVATPGNNDAKKCADCERLNQTIGFRCGKPYCLTRAVWNRWLKPRH